MNVEYFDTLPSTNQYCELLDLSQVEEFAVFCARSQTAGVGQRGNHWASAAGQNLTFSLVLKPVWLPVADQYLLTKVVSLGVADSLSSLLPAADVRIKWPNDIYVGRNKICGILVSNKVQGGLLSASVVGVGLNVNQTVFPEWVPNPVSLAQVAGHRFDLEEVLALVLEKIEARYRLAAARGVAAPACQARVDTEYLARLLNYGTASDYLYQGRRVRATIQGVNRFGHLLLTISDGTPVTCQMKEIKLL